MTLKTPFLIGGARLADEIACGMAAIAHFGVAAPEMPFRGRTGSDYGSERLDVRLQPKRANPVDL